MGPKLITEFVGTFFLVLTIALSGAAGLLAPVAIGIVLAVVVYMGGHVSGAHYNPAVSLALVMRGKLAAGALVPYVVAQLIGAVLAALVGLLLNSTTFVPTPGSSASLGAALLVEVLFTMLLVLTVLNVATAKAVAGNSFYGIAIGGAVLAAAFVGGPISGGAFNPAVGLGPAITHVLNGGSVGHVWIYLVGPLAGGIIAALLFRVQHGASAD